MYKPGIIDYIVVLVLIWGLSRGLTLKFFLRYKWLLDLPDLEIFLSIFDFFNGKKLFFAKMLIFT